jgi:ABC-type dipeptide/oligopeptide/nickel transport system permease subunit
MKTAVKAVQLPEKNEPYVPVDADFRLRDSSETVLDANYAAQSYWKEVFIRFFRKKSAVVGLIFIILIMLLAIFGPGMTPYTYEEQNLAQKNLAPRIPVIEYTGVFDGSESISTTTGMKKVNYYFENKLTDVFYWFGSDNFGRDIWTRTWSGARVSLIIAVAAAVIDMVIGMSYGLISGYFGGKTDMIMQRFLEICNGIPRLVIVTLLLLVLQPGMVTIIIALMLTEWVSMSRIARAEMLKLYHFPRDPAEYHRAHHHTGHVFHSDGYFYRGIPQLCGPWHSGAAVLAGVADLGRLQQFYHASLSDRPADHCHGTPDAQLQPGGGRTAGSTRSQNEGDVAVWKTKSIFSKYAISIYHSGRQPGRYMPSAVSTWT